MNVEILEFYPLERNEDRGILTGTLRVKLPDIGIELLGIYVSKQKNYWYFTLPGRMATHHETGETIRYPFIAFEDREKQRDLITAIREKGRAFIEARLTDTANPLIFSKKKRQQSRQTVEPKASIKETKPVVDSVPAKTIATKQWRDPPPERSHQKTPYFAKIRSREVTDAKQDNRLTRYSAIIRTFR